MKIDINKKYRTKDGLEVTHLHRAPDGWPVDCYPWRGLIEGNPATGTEEGRSGEQIGTPPNSDDLVEVREPRQWTLRVDGQKLRIWNGCTWQSGWPEGMEIRVREIID